MNWKNTDQRYGSAMIAMHWLMLLLIVSVYACIELREFYPKGSEPRETLKQWHFMLGLSVFLLVWLRLGLSLAQVRPAIQPGPPPWQRSVSKIVHVALYALMISQPLLGWLVLSAEGKSIPFFGLSLPPLVAEDEHLAELIEEIHEVVGTSGYFLITLHAVAALLHHYVMRDNTLVRMLPLARPRNTQ